jgi:hypothetical protein
VNLSSGFHNIKVQAQISAMGDNQSGTFTATALLGKGTLTADSTRLAVDPPYPYVISTQ